MDESLYNGAIYCHCFTVLLDQQMELGCHIHSMHLVEMWLYNGMQSCRTRVLDLDSSRTRVRFLEDLDSKAKDLDLDLKGEDLELGL